MAMGDDLVSAGFGDGDYPGEPRGDLGERDSRAGDGVEKSAMWQRRGRKPKTPKSKTPTTVGDVRDRLPEDMALSDMNSMADRNEATHWKEQYWRVERELRDKNDECSFLRKRAQRSPDLVTKEVAMNPTPNSAAPNTPAPVSVEGLQQEVEKLKKEKQSETNWACGLFVATSILFLVSVASIIHINADLFNQDEVNEKIAAAVVPFAATQPELALETLAEFKGVAPEYWNDEYRVVHLVGPPGPDRWIKLDKDAYDALKDFYGDGKWRNTTVNSVIDIILIGRKKQSAQTANPQKPVPISATEPKTDNGVEKVADSPKHSDAKAGEDKPSANDDAEWKKAAEGPYATPYDLKIANDFNVVECRDDLGVAKVVRGNNAKYLRLKPLFYIAFKLHMQEPNEWSRTVQRARLDLTYSFEWLEQHRDVVNSARMFGIAAQTPMLTGKEISEIPNYSTYVIGVDVATGVVHVIDDASFDERFIHVDKRWCETFNAVMANGDHLVCNAVCEFSNKYGYDAAHSDQPYVAPKPVDPAEELQKKLDELDAKTKEMTAKAEEMEKKTKEMTDWLIRAQQKALEDQRPAPKKQKKGKKI